MSYLSLHSFFVGLSNNCPKRGKPQFAIHCSSILKNANVETAGL